MPKIIVRQLFFLGFSNRAAVSRPVSRPVCENRAKPGWLSAEKQARRKDPPRAFEERETNAGQSKLTRQADPDRLSTNMITRGDHPPYAKYERQCVIQTSRARASTSRQSSTSYIPIDAHILRTGESFRERHREPGSEASESIRFDFAFSTLSRFRVAICRRRARKRARNQQMPTDRIGPPLRITTMTIAPLSSAKVRFAEITVMITILSLLSLLCSFDRPDLPELQFPFRGPDRRRGFASERHGGQYRYPHACQHLHND